MAWNRGQESESSPPQRAKTPASGMSTLGPSIHVKGDLTGGEDLRIEGSVDGTIRLEERSVLVSKSGKITADIHSSSICVEGQVRGNLYGEKEIVIRPSGKLEGNIMAPSVTLENGAMFRGSIDMEPKPRKEKTAAGKGQIEGKRDRRPATPTTTEPLPSGAKP